MSFKVLIEKKCATIFRVGNADLLSRLLETAFGRMDGNEETDFARVPSIERDRCCLNERMGGRALLGPTSGVSRACEDDNGRICWVGLSILGQGFGGIC